MGEARVKKLAELERDELKDVIARRLHGLDAGGPSLDGGDPIDWLVDAYRQAGREFRSRMDQIFDECLGELGDEERWPSDAASSLLDLLQEVGDNVTNSLFDMARSGVLLQSRGKEQHAGLLKCLISTNHKATPDFWWQQFGMLGPQFGALIASGLSDHGLDEVMRGLPRLCEHEKARQAFRFLWRHLVDQYGLRLVALALRGLQHQLPPDTYRLYLADLESLGWVDPTPSTAIALDGNATQLVFSAVRYKSEQGRFAVFRGLTRQCDHQRLEPATA